MQINTQKLKEYIQEYKALIQTPRYDELYKWEAAKNFIENWDEETTDVEKMLDKCLTASGDNLWVGSHFFLKKMLLIMAQHDGEKVMEMFRMLFDEGENLEERAMKFREEAEKIQQKAFKGRNSYQGNRAIMLYLGLRYPEIYPLYKFNMASDFASLVESSEPIGKARKVDGFKPVRQYLEMCELVRAELERDEDLLKMHRALLNPKIHYSGDYGALLTQDFIYCTTNYGSNNTITADDSEEEDVSEDDKPAFWLLAPGENARLWDDFYEEGIIAIGWDYLGNLKQYDNKEEIAEILREKESTSSSKMNDRLACWEFANVIKSGDIIITKKGRNSYLGWGIVTGDYQYQPDRKEYHHVRTVDWKKKGVWEADFKLGVKSLTDVTKYSEFVQKLQSLLGIDVMATSPVLSDANQPNYWWLNANPKIWSIDETKLGQIQNYTSHNEKGNKRQKYKYFTQVKPGDLVIGYETSPVKKVKSIFEITKALHVDARGKEIISFQKLQDLKEPLDYDLLKNLSELKNCEPLLNNQGSLFRILEEEYEVIRDLIDTKNLEVEQAEKTAKPYTKADALQDLFMSETSFDDIVRALEYKKNIVLQGPPGVGKTFVAKRIASYLIGKEDHRKIRTVQFHQSFSYEEFIMGIRPNTDGKFERKKGLFYEFCERAQNDPSSRYFLIIDEINRGNLSKIFGELMLLIESDKRGKKFSMPLMYSHEEESFYLPENLYLIGTMNTADRSLALVDYALRRRFAFIELIPEFEERFQEHLNQNGLPTKLVETIIYKLKEVNRIISSDPNLGKGFLIGHSYFCQLGAMASWSTHEAWYKDIIEWEIAPQLREYWFDDQEKSTEVIQSLLNI